MTELTSAQELFKGRHFDQEIIVLCVRRYLTFKLSFRDLVQMMAERGISLTHTTILGTSSTRAEIYSRVLEPTKSVYLSQVFQAAFWII